MNTTEAGAQLPPPLRAVVESEEYANALRTVKSICDLPTGDEQIPLVLAFGGLYESRGLTQRGLSAMLGKGTGPHGNQGWSMFWLRFGRFLAYARSNNHLEVLKGITQLRFEKFWKRTPKDVAIEAERFDQVIALMAQEPAPPPAQPKEPKSPKQRKPAAVAVAEPPIDTSILSKSAQEKFEILERRLRSRLAAEFDRQLTLRITQHIDEYVLPRYGERLQKADQLARIGKPLNNAEYLNLLRALHPDSTNPENRNAAFLLLKEKEILLRPEERDKPLSGGLPNTLAELMARRKKTARG